MTTAEMDAIYLDLAAGLNAAAVTCDDEHASPGDLLKTQYALDGMAGMLGKVRSAAPDDDGVDRMFCELSDSTTILRLVVLQRLCAWEEAA